MRAHILSILASLAVTAAAVAQPLTTEFTYQGELKNGASPASGQHDGRVAAGNDPVRRQRDRIQRSLHSPPELRRPVHRAEAVSGDRSSCRHRPGLLERWWLCPALAPPGTHSDAERDVRPRGRVEPQRHAAWRPGALLLHECEQSHRGPSGGVALGFIPGDRQYFQSREHLCWLGRGPEQLERCRRLYAFRPISPAPTQPMRLATSPTHSWAKSA
jgi:hypothetical protein